VTFIQAPHYVPSLALLGEWLALVRIGYAKPVPASAWAVYLCVPGIAVCLIVVAARNEILVVIAFCLVQDACIRTSLVRHKAVAVEASIRTVSFI
jgi:hypothetical protein